MHESHVIRKPDSPLIRFVKFKVNTIPSKPNQTALSINHGVALRPVAARNVSTKTQAEVFNLLIPRFA